MCVCVCVCVCVCSIKSGIRLNLHFHPHPPVSFLGCDVMYCIVTVVICSSVMLFSLLVNLVECNIFIEPFYGNVYGFIGGLLM